MNVPSSSQRQDWIFAHPWFWGLTGLALLTLAGGINFLDDADLFRSVRISLVVLGLLFTALGLRLILAPNPVLIFPEWGPGRQKMVLGGLLLVFLALAVGVTGIFLASFWGLVGRPGYLFLWWLLIVPMAVKAMEVVGQALRKRHRLEEREEASCYLILTAGILFLGRWAFYRSADPLDLDTLRLALTVAGLAALGCAPLVFLPPLARRPVLALAVLFHFGGICTASLAVPPTPTPISQLWVRIYRPYLEFMYINNAYHFYSPEPGAASYLWFRLIYETPDGTEFGDWFKVPKMNDKGEHGHPVALAYQRHLALTENAVTTEAKNFFEINKEGIPVAAKFWERRLLHVPLAVPTPVIVGVDPPRPTLTVPFHPDITQNLQYAPPNRLTKDLLGSYARHVCRLHEKAHEGMRVKSVKMYRAVHVITPSLPFVYGVLEPSDPTLYRAVYLGEFDPDGKLLDPNDPFLYWILPTLRDNPVDPNSRIRCYARKHAGDQEWIRNEVGVWVEK